jgi:hypothetical protein
MRLFLAALTGWAIGLLGSWLVVRPRRRQTKVTPSWLNETAYDKRGDHL